MNRELKFRVWSNRIKSFLSEEYLQQYEVCIACTGEYIIQNILYQKEKTGKDLIVQQYTGLQDKHGKDIYEGDIVEYNPNKPVFRIGVIEYSDYYNGWSIRDKYCYPESEYGCYSLSSPFLSFNDIKIVGNIFETLN